MTVEADVSFVDGALYSNVFKDRYAAADAVTECERVHIAPARLDERTQKGRVFTIFEFGFGAGINFLTIAERHLQNASTTRLRFVSCELFPLAWKDLKRALLPYKDRLSLLDDFLDSYPPCIPGIHRRLFAGDKIELTIYYADVARALDGFLTRDQQGVDAWILDGFAPDRNQSMWDPKLLARLIQRTNVGGTVTSFSSAGVVRRALADAGFIVQRVDNSPMKRHTTLGSLDRSTFTPQSVPKTATVYGGGFAGTATAHALARRGVNVELCTLSGKIADQTSSIPFAIMHGRLSVDTAAAPLFRAHAYFYSSCLGQRIQAIDQGIVQLPSRHMTERRLEALCELLDDRWMYRASPVELKEIANISVEQDGFFFSKSSVINGASLCNLLVEHDNISISKGHIEDDESWAGEVVAATRTNTPVRDSTSYLELANLLGQIDIFHTATPSSCMSKTVVRDGYCIPYAKTFVAGSTYEYVPWIDGRSTAVNRKRLNDLVPGIDFDHASSFSGARAVTSDRVPIVGRTSNNLWLNLGHGSSGTTTAPFAGELLASVMCGEVPPASAEVVAAIAPHRFLERQKRRPNPFTSSQVSQGRTEELG